MLVQGYFLRFVFSKAASTSSFLMRDLGTPISPRFCSSVPSPIIPGCVIFGALLGLAFIGHVKQSRRDCAFLNSGSGNPFRLKAPPTSASAFGIMAATLTDLRSEADNQKDLLSQLDLRSNLSVTGSLATTSLTSPFGVKHLFTITSSPHFDAAPVRLGD